MDWYIPSTFEVDKNIYEIFCQNRMGQMTEVINNGQRIMWWKNHMIRVHTFLELKVWTGFGLNLAKKIDLGNVLPFGYTYLLDPAMCFF